MHTATIAELAGRDGELRVVVDGSATFSARRSRLASLTDRAIIDAVQEVAGGGLHVTREHDEVVTAANYLEDPGLRQFVSCFGPTESDDRDAEQLDVAAAGVVVRDNAEASSSQGTKHAVARGTEVT